MKANRARIPFDEIVLALLVVLALVLSFRSAKADLYQSPIEFILAEQARSPLPDHVRAAGRKTGGPGHAGHVGGAVGALLAASAARNHVPLHVARAIMTIESRGRCHARSHSNARGAMQVLPATARSVGISGNLYDCATGIEAGMRYLRLVISTHGLSCGGLSTYERGIFARPRCTAYGRRAVRLAGL